MTGYLYFIIYLSTVASQTNSTFSICDWNCKFVNIITNTDNISKIQHCISITSILDQNKCIDSAVGLNPAYSASMSARAGAIIKYCPNLSPSDTDYCLANHYNITNFDYNITSDCENQCNQTTANELYACYMTCNAPLQIKINFDRTVSNVDIIRSYYNQNNGISNFSINSFHSIILSLIIALYTL
jgi:hypothetical protein